MELRPEESNPCEAIRRYRRKGRERFLSDDEIGRLSERLSAQVAAIRFFLTTPNRSLQRLEFDHQLQVPARI